MDKEFKFSEVLLKKVKGVLVDRIADVLDNDHDTRESFAEYGFPGVHDVNGNELLDMYMEWTGIYSLEENPDDELLKTMMLEVAAFELEKQALGEQV